MAVKAQNFGDGTEKPDYRNSGRGDAVICSAGTEFVSTRISVLTSPSLIYTDLSYWHIGRKFDVPIYTTRDIYINSHRQCAE
jgi:hypothetical protein